MRGEAEALEILESADAVEVLAAVCVGHLVKVAELGLDDVWAEESVGDEGARQFTVHNVMAQLQSEQVASDFLLKDVWLGRVKLDLEAERRLDGGYDAFQLRLDLFIVVKPKLKEKGIFILIVLLKRGKSEDLSEPSCCWRLDMSSWSIPFRRAQGRGKPW